MRERANGRLVLVPATKSYRTRRRTVHEWRMLLSRIRRSVFSFLGHYRSTETYIVPPRGREVGPGGGEVTVPLVRSILHDTRALLRFREFFSHQRVSLPRYCATRAILFVPPLPPILLLSSFAATPSVCPSTRPPAPLHRSNDFCISRSIRAPSLDNGSPNSSSEMSN